MPIRWRLHGVLHYYLRSFIYAASPALLRYVERKLGYMPAHRSAAFWDSELAGPKRLYLTGTLSSDVRDAVITILIRHYVPDAQSVLDVGCGGGAWP